MEMDTIFPDHHPQNHQASSTDHHQCHRHHHKTGDLYMPLLIFNSLCLFIGSVSANLLAKYYFIHKGSSRWVSTWVQSAGFPLLLLPIYLPYILNRTQRPPFSDFTLRLVALSVFIGLMLGINNLLFSWGTSYLPVSTSSLLLSTQLAFNLILSALIVKQKITFSNLNCVVLLTLSSVLLALSSSQDRPPGLTRADYFMGFISTIGAGLLFALYLPLMEKIYRKVDCYAIVVEMQLVMEAAATVMATVGMAADGGFEDMRREGTGEFDKGWRLYCVTVAMNVVCWQMSFMGTAGMVFMTSSLTGGICMTALLGMNVLGGVVVYGDEFGGVKAVSMVLCVWGFCSYVYGMHVIDHKQRQQPQPQPPPPRTFANPITSNRGPPPSQAGRQQPQEEEEGMEMGALARTVTVVIDNVGLVLLGRTFCGGRLINSE